MSLTRIDDATHRAQRTAERERRAAALCAGTTRAAEQAKRLQCDARRLVSQAEQANAAVMRAISFRHSLASQEGTPT